MIQVLVTISPTIAIQKRSMGYAKFIHKKREKKRERKEKHWKNGQVSKVLK